MTGLQKYLDEFTTIHAPNKMQLNTLNLVQFSMSRKSAIQNLCLLIATTESRDGLVGSYLVHCCECLQVLGRTFISTLG